MGSCTTHFIVCGVINSCCCLVTGGLTLGFPGCFAACYACGYRKALRTKYNLQVGSIYAFFEFLIPKKERKKDRSYLYVVVYCDVVQEAPCGDLITHLCCHLCAVCQEYREIRERSVDINPNANLVEVTAPEVQTMDLAVVRN